MNTFLKGLAALFLALLATQPAISAESVGKAVSVDQTAYVQRDDRAIRLYTGSELFSGDVVVTEETGLVQITFFDQTRIAVGPNSRLALQNIVKLNDERASGFAVQAVAGAFRFITGRTAKDDYQISTPVSTFGIRGTAFDIFVGDGIDYTILLQGRILKCIEGQALCTDMQDYCSAATAFDYGDFEYPANIEDRNELILQYFPFIKSQIQLLGTFRKNTRWCGRVAEQIKREPREERGCPTGTIWFPPIDFGEFVFPGGCYPPEDIID